MLHPPRPGIVSRQRFDHVEVVALQEFAQIARAPSTLAPGSKELATPKLGGGLRHQLHQTPCPFGRHGTRVESTLGVDHAVNEIGIEVMPVADGIDDFVEILWLRFQSAERRNQRSGPPNTGAIGGAMSFSKRSI